MKIWILNQYASLPRDGIGGRHRHIARELAALGHEVSVVAARWTHLTRDREAAQKAPALEWFEGFKFLRIDLPTYRHAHDPRRILNWALFALKLPGLPRLLGETPDVVLYSSPSLIGYLGAERLARKVKARLVFEVRDIWPLTLMEIGSHSAMHPFIRFLQWVEDRAYRVADRVISNLPGAVEHMQTRGMDRKKFEWIPNGMSAAELDAPSAPNPSELQHLAKGRFVVGYTGTLGLANAMGTALEAAELLGSEHQILLVLVGSGSERARLEQTAERMKLGNVVFLPPVPKAEVQSLIRSFDACLLCWHHSPLYEFGTAANKLFDYFYAARPVIQAYSGKYDLVSEYDAGLTVTAEDPEALAAAIVKMRDLPESERARMGENGRHEALRLHEYREIAKLLERVVQPS